MDAATHSTNDPWREAIEALPTDHQVRAERIRAHLVALRGGAPFLSPMDADLLLSWLDAAVDTAAVLVALEDASSRRRKARARAPLALHHAAGDLKRRLTGRAPTISAMPATMLTAEPTSDVGLQAVIAPLRALHPDCARAAALATALHALGDREPDALAEAVISAASQWLAEAWDALAERERDAALAAARREICSWADDLDEGELAELAEEVARGHLRERYPMLTATFILRQLA